MMVWVIACICHGLSRTRVNPHLSQLGYEVLVLSSSLSIHFELTAASYSSANFAFCSVNLIDRSSSARDQAPPSDPFLNPEPFVFH